MRQVLRFPEEIRTFCARRYRNQRRHWLAGNGTWPMVLPLGCPTEAEVQTQPRAVQDWVSAWRDWQGPGDLLWCDRRWRSIGIQRVPERLMLSDALAVATCIGEENRWKMALTRFRRFVARWPVLGPVLRQEFDSLASYSDQDISRLEALVAWIESNPRSNLYPRQIPLPGLDTKWLESRTGLVTDLIACLQASGGPNLDFYDRCGLHKPPRTARVRILDEALRAKVGGLSDITAPISDLAQLQLTVSRIYIVENVQTGLCFSERRGSVVFMGLGYGVSSLGQVPWATNAECVYWGDVDTHGFAILNCGRTFLRKLRSVLMDEETLLGNRELWGQEGEQFKGSLPFLTRAEQTVYEGLCQNRWAQNLRLEQERIVWDRAWEVLGRPQIDFEERRSDSKS